MVMIILGVLSAVAIPRYLDTIQKAEEAAEDAVISNISVALENYGVHKLIDSGRAIWPDNPFDALNKVPPSYDKSQSTLMTQMKDSDWIYTGQASNDYKNSIVHRRKEDSLAIWTYDKTTGEIGYSNPPYKPNQVVYRPDLQGQ